MRSITGLLISILLLTACEEKKPEVQAKQAIAFSIPDTKEEIIQKHTDGLHKLSVYTHTQSGAKVAEVEFHPNGQPKIYKKFENDTMEGESWCYYEDGKPWSLNTFHNGKYHGVYKTWHENGQLHISGNYREGKEIGEWFTYYPNGQINTRGMYREGVKTGVWSSYNMEGSLRREQDFDKDSE